MKTKNTLAGLFTVGLIAFSIPAIAEKYQVNFTVAHAFGFDYKPSPTYNGIYFPYGSISAITVQFDDTLLKEETFNVRNNSGVTRYYALDAESLVSDFTNQLPPVNGDRTPSLLPLELAQVQFTNYFPIWAPTGRSQAVFSIRAREPGAEYSVNVLIDRAGATWTSLTDFLFASLTGNVYEHGYKEHLATISGGTIFGGSGFDADISLSSLTVVSVIPEPNSGLLFACGLGVWAIVRPWRHRMGS